MSRLLDELELQAHFLLLTSPIWVTIAVAVYTWVVTPL